MLLISLLLAVLLKQFWESSNPLHHDEWITKFKQTLSNSLQKFHIDSPLFVFILAITLLTITCLLIDLILQKEATLLHVVFATVILLYSFGRGDFNQFLTAFIVAEAKQDWPAALESANAIKSDTDDLGHNDWQSLNTRFLAQASYLGFERFFAVVFWFALLGPVGALGYRFSQLWCAQYPSKQVAHWLWVIEWPAVRVLSLTYAITGNFAGCIAAWKKNVFCQQRPSKVVLHENLLGALAVDENLEQSQEVTRRELEALQQLLSRTLWCWVGIIGFLYMM